MKVLKHVLAVPLALFLLLGVPALRYVDVAALWRGEDADAVSQATVELPDTPSGDFVVFLNRTKHAGTLEQWGNFFAEKDYGILLEDVRCMVISGDPTAGQLAERYQARLVKDQMTVRRENGVMVASRLGSGVYDMVIVSREMAEAWQLTDSAPPDAAVVVVEGGAP